MKSNFLWRIRLATLLVFLFSLLLISRLFFIQIVRGEYYADRSRQQLNPGRELFDRGTIFFSEKNGQLVSAATLKNGYTLAINPKKIKNGEEIYNQLSATVSLPDKTNFLAKVAKTNDPYEEIIARLDESVGQKIKNLKIDGVILTPNRWRFYPAGERAAQTIGFMGYRGDIFTGLYGLEKEYDEILNRRRMVSFGDFFAEIFSGLINNQKDDYKKEQGDIVTTIEPSVESFLENKLIEIENKWRPETTGGIIINPTNGEILALATRPTFNPSAKQSNISILNNPLVEHVFEMGSVVKPLTIAAALDLGVITPETIYDDPGIMIIDGREVGNFDKRARGQVNFQEVLNQSLNTGAVTAMRKMGIENFRRYFKNYGLTEKTGVDLPNEALGLVDNLNSPREVEYATASFGQGFAVTPLTIVRAFASLANGGTLIQPHVVKKINYQSTLTKAIAPPAERRVLKPETSEMISRMLTRVVDEALQQGRVKNPHYQIAAKTGTAQLIAKEGTGGYDKNHYLHSFFGYFPSSAPKFLIFLYAVRPQGADYASETLTEPFMDLTEFLINYYQIPPDRL